AALIRGTRKRTFQKLNDELDKVGMSFGIGAGRETISFSGKCLTEDFDRWLDLAADVLLHPTFPRAEVEKLRHEILADLKEAEDDTGHVARRDFLELCYPHGHPYYHFIDGTPASVKRLAISQLREFHARFFRPDLTTIVIVGDLRASAAIEKIARAFGKWQARGAPPPYNIPDAPRLVNISRRDKTLAGKTQSDLYIGYPGIRRNNPDYYALVVGDLIFGRIGLSGRLGAKVRDEMGLAYYVYSGVEANLGAGPWTIHAGINPKNIQRAIDAIVAETKRLREEQVTQDELNEAKDFMIGSLAIGLETNDGVAGTLANIELHQLGLDYLQRYPQIIRSVSAEQIRAATQKYAQIDSYALAIAGPGSS
ncbi:MAG: insulinase family protein, partial [Chloroflexi bacterium]|nr:insulinase family protein [Chloroflexota bacterium]